MGLSEYSMTEAGSPMENPTCQPMYVSGCATGGLQRPGIGLITLLNGQFPAFLTNSKRGQSKDLAIDPFDLHLPISMGR